MRPDDLLESFEIDPAARVLPANARPEPLLAAAPFLVEFDEPERLDPARAAAAREPSPPPAGRGRLPFGLLGSLAIHLLPLLVLLDWSSPPAAITPPIPVQLVLEAPPPAPEKAPPPAPKKLPPLGRLASEDVGQPAAEPDQPAAAAAPATAQPQETQTAAVPPPPKPIPPPEPAAALPEPRAAAEPPVMPREAKPTPPPRPPARQAVAARLPPNPNPYPAPRATHVPGPAATRDEYLAYCTALVSRYRGVLPLSLVGGRHGMTVLTITVLDDGTIARIAVKQSSGYGDIDARVEQMVAAVRKFPPLPQWIQASKIDMDLTMPFPEGLAEH